MFLSKRNNGVYYIWYTNTRGRKSKVSTKSTRKIEALRFLKNFNEEEGSRKAGHIRKFLSEFFSDYQRYAKSVHTIKTQHSTANAFRELIRIVGDIWLDKLGVREIESFLAQKNEEASVWTARKYYISLASAFETAKRWDYISSNPFRKVRKPKPAEVLPCYLTKDEMQKLLCVVGDEQFRHLYLFAVLTGLRQGELINLQWSGVDLVGSIIHVRNSEVFTTKSKKNRSVPMNERLNTIATRMKASASSELVFHHNGKLLSANRISKAFKSAVRKAALNDRLHFHSLRHTFASWLVQDGVSLYEIQKLLGHSNITVTQVYSHLQPEGLHDTVNRISFELVTGQNELNV